MENLKLWEDLKNWKKTVILWNSLMSSHQTRRIGPVSQP